MSKRFLRNCLSFGFLCVFLFAAHIGYAQRYDFTASAGTFTPLTGATSLSTIQDDGVLSAAVPIGFSFTYFGAAYTTLKVSSNGFITFDAAATSSLNENSIPTSYLKMVAPLWDDLDGTGGTASYKLTGTAGSQVMTIEWLNWKWNWLAASAGISFQVKLYEGTNKIEFVYSQVAGALNSASASIGLIGNTTNAFYSLTNASASPVLSANGSTTINTKPATGQVYSFLPNANAIVAPTVAASAITVSPIGSVTSTISWTNGNGANRAVFVKQTSSTSDFYTPTTGSRYPSSSVFGDSYISADWYCVYNGQGNSVALTNLQSTYSYRVQVVEYNGLAGLQQYNSTQVGSNFTTTLAAPVAPASTLTTYRAGASQAYIGFTAGNGNKRSVFMKATSAVETAPVLNNTTYTANTIFGTGTQVGTSGWYCVYDGTFSDEFQVTGLSSGTGYRIHVVDYNGTAGVEKYFVSAVTNNPIQITTLSTPPSLPTYTFAATSGTFTPLTGGTAVNNIESDDSFSDLLPIGFTFRLGGTPFTQFKASSNGYITFNSFASNSLNSTNRANDLTSSNIRPLVAAFWDDLDGTGGQASYSTSGVSPNRVFTLEYLNWKSYGGSTALSFQIKLYEVNSKIEYVYRQEAGALNSPSASIGLSLPDIGTGTYAFLSLNNTSASPAMSSVLETSNLSTKPANSQVYSFTPSKADQTIIFASLASKTFGDLPFTLTASSTSGLPVSYTSSNTAVATVSGNTVTLVGIGTTQIIANQAGDAGVNAATPVEQPLVVNVGNQTITFAAIPTKTLGDAPFALSATATSSLPVTFTTTSDKITIAAGQVTLVKAGSVTVKADQAGNGNYNAATTAERTFCINPAKPVVTLSGSDTEAPVLTSSNTAGNQWFKEGLAISGSTGTTFSPTTPGIYTVISTVDNCSSVSSEQQVIIVTGVEDISKLITVFPNPVQKEVTIDLTSLGKEVSADVAIFDLAGRVFHSSSGKGKMTVNIASYDKGNYMVRVKAGSRIVTKQIAKN